MFISQDDYLENRVKKKKTCENNIAKNRCYQEK